MELKLYWGAVVAALMVLVGIPLMFWVFRRQVIRLYVKLWSRSDTNSK